MTLLDIYQLALSLLYCWKLPASRQSSFKAIKTGTMGYVCEEHDAIYHLALCVLHCGEVVCRLTIFLRRRDLERVGYRLRGKRYDH